MSENSNSESSYTDSETTSSSSDSEFSILDKRLLICKEILRFERNFINCIDILVRVFYQKLKRQSKSNEDIITPKQVKNIFSNSRSILLEHVNFLHSFEYKLLIWKEDIEIGQLFSSTKSHLKQYLAYYQNYVKALFDLKKCEQSTAFCELIDQLETINLANFHDLLKEPTKYIYEYKDLVLKLLKQTKPKHSDHKILSQLLITIDESIAVINNKKKRKLNEIQSKERKTLENIQKRFVSKIKIISRERWLIFEGSLTKISRSQKQKRHFFLFNDILVVGSPHPIKKNQLNLHYILNLENVKLENKEDSVDLKNSFSLKSGGKTFTVFAKDSITKKKWILYLKTVINRMKKNKGIKQDSVFVNDTKKKKKISIKKCIYCKNQFTITRKKHKCKNCEKIICDNCSPYKIILKHIANKVVRVCKNCYLELEDSIENSALGIMKTKSVPMKQFRKTSHQSYPEKLMKKNLQKSKIKPIPRKKRSNAKKNTKQSTHKLQNDRISSSTLPRTNNINSNESTTSLDHKKNEEIVIDLNSDSEYETGMGSFTSRDQAKRNSEIPITVTDKYYSFVPFDLTDSEDETETEDDFETETETEDTLALKSDSEVDTEIDTLSDTEKNGMTESNTEPDTDQDSDKKNSQNSEFENVEKFNSNTNSLSNSEQDSNIKK
ncbi:faciogenital dysplasia protein [Anaeramoeba flamelloides]|uniref:Faciogenital dysplasia protein n=1 Tax=Anaeramoeba flamelloides TaxID=1746091 RepID=A0ABQ8Z8F0_9EUKA|nr:faciogenital dysplasia protein [Anaeramoeba flamelloides]